MASNPVPSPAPVPSSSSHAEALPASLEAEIFWTKNQGKIIAGIVLLLVALCLYGVFQVTNAQKQAAAATALAEAKTPEQLRGVIGAYPNSAVSGNARILIAEQFTKDKKYDEAIAEYETFVREQPAHPLAPSGWLGVASIREQQNQLDAAITAYQTVRSQYKDSYAVPFAMLSEGKLLARQGKTSESKELLEKLAADYPASAFSNFATREIEAPLPSEAIIFTEVKAEPAPTPGAAPVPNAGATPAPATITVPSPAVESASPAASPSVETAPSPAASPDAPAASPSPAAP